MCVFVQGDVFAYVYVWLNSICTRICACICMSVLVTCIHTCVREEIVKWAIYLCVCFEIWLLYL